MKTISLRMGAFLGGLSVIFGAFGAHALKSLLNQAQLESFQTGVRYQMLHALVLLFVGFYFNFTKAMHKYMAWFFIIGTLLFSFSIYLLSLSAIWGVKLSFLGPITPLGGLLLIMGWLLMFLSFKPQKN